MANLRNPDWIKDVHVSRHAALRYVERVNGLDQAENKVRKLLAGSYPAVPKDPFKQSLRFGFEPTLYFKNKLYVIVVHEITHSVLTVYRDDGNQFRRKTSDD